MAETQAGESRPVHRPKTESPNSSNCPMVGSVWRINADTGTYRLTIDDVGVEWQCTCPAALRGRQDCAHAWAVLKLMGLEPEPVEVVHLDTPIAALDVAEEPCRRRAVRHCRRVHRRPTTDDRHSPNRPDR